MVSTKKFHVNPGTGETNPCKAIVSCPYGAGAHVGSRNEAEEFFAKAMVDSTHFLYEKERSRLKPIREGYLQGKLHTKDLRVNDILVEKVTAGGDTWDRYSQILSIKDEGNSRFVVKQELMGFRGNWSARPDRKEVEARLASDDNKPNALRFVLREKPAGWQ